MSRCSLYSRRQHLSFFPSTKKSFIIRYYQIELAVGPYARFCCLLLPKRNTILWRAEAALHLWLMHQAFYFSCHARPLGLWHGIETCFAIKESCLLKVVNKTLEDVIIMWEVFVSRALVIMWLGRFDDGGKSCDTLRIHQLIIAIHFRPSLQRISNFFYSWMSKQTLLNLPKKKHKNIFETMVNHVKIIIRTCLFLVIQLACFSFKSDLKNHALRYSLYLLHLFLLIAPFGYCYKFSWGNIINAMLSTWKEILFMRINICES